MKLKTKVALKAAKLISKLDLNFDNLDTSANAGEIGKSIMLQILNKVGDAEEEIIELISVVAECSKEQALEIDLIELFSNETGEDGLIAFFKSAVKSNMPESSNS